MLFMRFPGDLGKVNFFDFFGFLTSELGNLVGGGLVPKPAIREKSKKSTIWMMKSWEKRKKKFSWENLRGINPEFDALSRNGTRFASFFFCEKVQGT